MRLLFFDSPVIRGVVATLTLCLPVYFAGLIFVSSFVRVNFEGSALGSNLFGSLAGGLLESLSLWFGLKSLTLMAILLYAGSLVTIMRRRTQRPSPVLEVTSHA
jgi:hypothetical protein